MLNKFFLLTTILLWHLANAYSQNKLPITFGKVSLEDLRNYAIANGEPKVTSGKQEYIENLINRYI